MKCAIRSLGCKIYGLRPWALHAHEVLQTFLWYQINREINSVFIFSTSYSILLNINLHFLSLTLYLPSYPDPSVRSLTKLCRVYKFRNKIINPVMSRSIHNNVYANSPPCFLNNDSKFTTLHACLSTGFKLFKFTHAIEMS